MKWKDRCDNWGVHRLGERGSDKLIPQGLVGGRDYATDFQDRPVRLNVPPTLELRNDPIDETDKEAPRVNPPSDAFLRTFREASEECLPV